MGREEVSDVSRRETAMWHRRTKVAGVLHFRVAAAGTPEWGLLLAPPQISSIWLFPANYCPAADDHTADKAHHTEDAL